MKYIDKLSIRLAVASIIGFLFAGAATKISNVCEPVNGAVGCASFDKAIMHLGDLLNNQQDSLVHFATNFAVATLVIFVILSVVSLATKKKT